MTGDWGSESDDLGLSSEGSDGEDENVRSSTAGQETEGLGADLAGLQAASGAGAGPGGDEADLHEYAKSMGVDLSKAEENDLRSVVREAFAAPLPPSWTEHLDEEGRVYFFNQVTMESSWTHPMDVAYKEVIEIVKAIRQDPTTRLDAEGLSESTASPSPILSSRQQAVQAHLEEVHQRALKQIDGWSGPYSSEAGQYFYHAGYDVSSWENPIDEWQRELILRQRVLFRCLLEQPRNAAAGENGADSQVPGDEGRSLYSAPAVPPQLGELPRLRLALTTPSLSGGEVPKSPSSTRSFATARSGRSARSARSPTPVRKASGASATASPGRGPLAASPGRGLAALASPGRTAVATAAAQAGGSPHAGAALAAAPAAGPAAEAQEASPAVGELPPAAKVPEECAPPAAKAVAQAMAGAAAGEDDEDSMEFTFGSTQALQLPQFGKVGAKAGA